MAFCRHCGTKLDEGSRFCTNCGTENTNEEQNPYAPPRQSAAEFASDKNPWSYFTGVFKKYAVFQGRARRAEFWWFTLFHIIFSFVVSILDGIFDLYITGDTGILEIFWSLAVFIPSLSVTVRRMHDCDKSGWFMLIPIYGQIILPCTKGTYGPNSYGPDPKEENSKQEI
jgi:uncharacterized membrane protein YhaH (DUF805 family)